MFWEDFFLFIYFSFYILVPFSVKTIIPLALVGYSSSHTQRELAELLLNLQGSYELKNV